MRRRSRHRAGSSATPNPNIAWLLRTESLKLLAHPKGFEPLASAFGGQRSIQLSYGCIPNSAILADVGVARQSAVAAPAHVAKRRHGGNETSPHGGLRSFGACGSAG